GCGFSRLALDLVEEPGVIERDGHASGERLQEAHVGIAEGVLTLEVDEVDEAARLSAHEQRNEDLRFRRHAAGKAIAAEALRRAREILVDDERLSGPQ